MKEIEKFAKAPAISTVLMFTRVIIGFYIAEHALGIFKASSMVAVDAASRVGAAGMLAAALFLAFGAFTRTSAIVLLANSLLCAVFAAGNGAVTEVAGSGFQGQTLPILGLLGIAFFGAGYLSLDVHYVAGIFGKLTPYTEATTYTYGEEDEQEEPVPVSAFRGFADGEKAPELVWESQLPVAHEADPAHHESEILSEDFVESMR